MKTLHALNIVLILMVSALAGCSGGNRDAEVKDTLTQEDAEKREVENGVTKTEAGEPEFTVSEIFRKQVSELFEAYIGLKEAFVASDANNVRKEANATAKQLAAVDMKELSGAAYNDWIIYHGEMSSALEKIKAADDIEAQREHFERLSYSFYKTIKAYGLGGATAYYTYCPMAFNDKGAYWLSDNDEIRNPYFGDAMLTCGSVEETLK